MPRKARYTFPEPRMEPSPGETPVADSGIFRIGDFAVPLPAEFLLVTRDGRIIRMEDKPCVILVPNAPRGDVVLMTPDYKRLTQAQRDTFNRLRTNWRPWLQP